MLLHCWELEQYLKPVFINRLNVVTETSNPYESGIKVAEFADLGLYAFYQRREAVGVMDY